MIKIIMEIDQPDYHQIADLVVNELQNRPDLAARIPKGLNPTMLQFAVRQMSNPQINSMLISAIERDQQKAIQGAEQGLRQSGAQMSVHSIHLEDGETLKLSMIADVLSWTPMIEQLIPHLVSTEDLPMRMGGLYTPDSTVQDYAQYLESLPMYDQTMQFFSCCTAAKDRMLQRTEEMLTERSLPLRLRNMRFFVKR